MKTFSNYIDNIKLIDEICSYEYSDVVLEGILKKIANWFGNKSRNISNKLNNFYDELYYFPDNVIKTFNGTLSIAADETNDSQENKDIINNIINDKPENIPEKVINYLKEHENDKDFYNSILIASLCVLGINVANENKDQKSVDTIKLYFNKISDKIKEDTKDILKKSTNNPDNNDNDNDNNPSEDLTKKVDDVVQNVVDDNPDIDINKEKERELIETITWMIFYKYNKNNMNSDEIEDNAKRLANILINELELDDDLKQKFNITSLDDLKQKIEDYKNNK